MPTSWWISNVGRPRLSLSPLVEVSSWLETTEFAIGGLCPPSSTQASANSSARFPSPFDSSAPLPRPLDKPNPRLSSGPKVDLVETGEDIELVKDFLKERFPVGVYWKLGGLETDSSKFEDRRRRGGVRGEDGILNARGTANVTFLSLMKKGLIS